MKPLTIDACIERYGRIQGHYEGGLLWSRAPEWVKPFPVPPEILMVSSLSKPVYRIFCNTDTHEPLAKAFSLLIETGCYKELKTFDGCWAVRWVRGHPGQLSFHSYAVAFDYNAKLNRLGAQSSWSPEFVKCFEDSGFEWGGRWKSRLDCQHFQLKMIPSK